MTSKQLVSAALTACLALGPCLGTAAPAFAATGSFDAAKLSARTVAKKAADDDDEEDADDKATREKDADEKEMEDKKPSKSSDDKDADDKDADADADDKDADDKASSKKSDYPQPTEAPDYEYEIEKVGSFTGGKNAISNSHGAPILQEGKDEKYYLIGPDGKPLVDDEVAGAAYIGDGLYVVSLASDDINCTGLIDSDGEEIIPLEAAAISWATDRAEDACFLKVTYATEETDNKDECFIYKTDDSFSLSPDEDDTMYKGYAEVYSIEEGKMVKGVRIENPSTSAFHDLFDSFTVDTGEETILYDASGKELWTGANYCNVYSDGIILNGSQLYDAEGELRYAAKDSVSKVDGNGQPNGYFKMKDGDKYVVIDIDGNQVLEGSYDQINYSIDGLFDVGSGSDEKVVNSDGETVVEYSSSIKGILPGYHVARAKNEYVLLKSGEEVVSGESGEYNKLVIEDNDKYYTLNDEKFELELSNCYSADIGLATARPADSNVYYYGLYDFFTGEALLEDEYEKIEVIGDYVFAYANGTWTTYELVLTER